MELCFQSENEPTPSDRLMALTTTLKKILLLEKKPIRKREYYSQPILGIELEVGDLAIDSILKFAPFNLGKGLVYSFSCDGAIRIRHDHKERVL